MFRKVLVPLDGSALSERVLDSLKPVLQLESASVITLCVEAEPTSASAVTSHSADLSSFRPVAKTKALKRQGDPAEQILIAAETEGVSLIAMSTHGRTGLSSLVRGSVAERVLRGAEVPVLLLNPFTKSRPAGSPIRRILAPLDGSAVSAAAMPLVAQLAKVYASHVTIFHVGTPESHESPAGETREAARAQQFREHVAPYVDQLAEDGTRSSVDVVFGFGAASQILTAVENQAIDLVALTTHGRSGLSRWLFGSVAEHVVRECRAPLLVKRISEGSCA